MAAVLGLALLMLVLVCCAAGLGTAVEPGLEDTRLRATALKEKSGAGGGLPGVEA